MNRCFRVSALLVVAIFICLPSFVLEAQAQDRSVLSKRSLPPHLQNLPPQMLAKMPWLQPDQTMSQNLQLGLYPPSKFKWPEVQRQNSQLSQAQPLSKTAAASGGAQFASSCLSEDWVARYDGPENSYDVDNALAIDGSGNVYVTGFTFGAVGNGDYVTIKYDANGVQQWETRYNGPANETDKPLAIAVDGTGNVYVTGYSANSDFTNDYATIKYDAAGVQQWEARYNGPANSGDGANAIALDGSGNVYVTGTSTNSDQSTAYATIKYDAVTGVQQWEARYSKGNAFGLALDGNGNVYVTGITYDVGNSGDYATIKYDAAGVQQWVARYNGPANSTDFAGPIAVDGSSNVYVTGSSYNADFTTDYATIKYDAAGVQQWVARYNGPANGSDVAGDISVDGSGNVYVTGGSNGDYATIKYSIVGVQLWEALYDGPGNSYDQATRLEVNGSGDVYVMGRSTNSDNNIDYAILIYSSTGALQCEARYNGPANSEDEAYAFALDGSGNVYVTGYSVDFNEDFATIKYSPQSSCLAAEVGTIIVPLNPVQINTAINASANFTAECDNDDHSATWDWGDNTTSAGTVDQSGNSVTGSHTYTAAGVNTVTLTVTDGAGNSGEGTATAFIVIYDPSAGFVTGGGWIMSPAGAYVADPTLTGKANFGFVSKYQKGKTIPDGNTEFNFKTGNLNFRSTAYEWLVIAGPNAKYKGSGTINNSGNYGFMLTARDGQVNGGGGVDKFRIKIWDKNNGDAVVYDNQMNDPDDANATDAIEGGSIAIHSSGASKETADASEAVPVSFMLEQNYPNPFNPSTTINFALPQAGQVTITIYSSTGQLVRELLHDEMSVGLHAINWDGRNQKGEVVATGMYLYRLVANGANGEVVFAETRRMAFVK